MNIKTTFLSENSSIFYILSFEFKSFKFWVLEFWVSEFWVLSFTWVSSFKFQVSLWVLRLRISSFQFQNFEFEFWVSLWVLSFTLSFKFWVSLLKGPINLKPPYNFSELYQSSIVLAEWHTPNLNYHWWRLPSGEAPLSLIMLAGSG